MSRKANTQCVEHTSLRSSIKQSIAISALFLHSLHLGWDLFSFSHHHHTAPFLSVFRLLPLRKLWANDDCVVLLKESLHVVRWMEMKRGAGPGEPLLLLSVTQQTRLRKLNGIGHIGYALEVSRCLPGSFKVSGVEKKLLLSHAGRRLIFMTRTLPITLKWFLQV